MATHHAVTNQSIEFIDRVGSSEDFLIRKNGKWPIRERRVAS
jgi:hypothetical protein